MQQQQYETARYTCTCGKTPDCKACHGKGFYEEQYPIEKTISLKVNVTTHNKWIFDNVMKRYGLKTEKKALEKLIQLGIDEMAELDD